MNRRAFLKTVAALGAASAVPALPATQASAAETLISITANVNHLVNALRRLTLTLEGTARAVDAFADGVVELEVDAGVAQIEADLIALNPAALPAPGSVVDAGFFRVSISYSDDRLRALFQHMPEDMQFLVERVRVESDPYSLPVARLEMREVIR